MLSIANFSLILAWQPLRIFMACVSRRFHIGYASIFSEKFFATCIGIACFLPFWTKHITQSEPIVYFPFLVIVANSKCLFVERNGCLVFLQLEMALCIGKIIHRAFVRSKHSKAWCYFVEILCCTFIFPFVVIAQTNISTKSGRSVCIVYLIVEK